MTAQPQSKPNDPYAPMSRQAMRRSLESHRETIAQQIWFHTTAISALQGLMEDSDSYWNASQPDEAPAFQPRFSLVGAS